MLREMKGIDKNSSLYQRVQLGELADRVPTIVDTLHQKTPIPLSVITKERLCCVEEALADGNLAAATELIEASYQRDWLLEHGVYEHNILTNPILEKFACSKDGMEAAVHSAEQAGFWYQDCPENPYSSALFALAVHQLGFESPATNWLPDADDDAPSMYDQCVEHMKQVMDESEFQHGDHWFWQWAQFYLSISDYRGHKDLWAKFDQALSAQPHSLELWETMAIRLLPRWHGKDGDLSKLGRRAWMHTRRNQDASAYLEVFRTVNFHENGDHELILLDDICDLLVTQYAKSGSDLERTLAVSALATKERHDEAARLMAQMTNLHSANWLCSYDPQWVVGIAEIHRPANTLAA